MATQGDRSGGAPSGGDRPADRAGRPAAEGFDLLPEAVVFLDDQQRVAAFNERARLMLGLGEDAVGTDLFEAVELRDDADTRCERSWLPHTVVADRLAEHVLHVRLPSGNRPVSVAGSFHGDGLVLTFRSAGRRERVDAARSDVVATVSHEIRSPLTSVKGFTSTMLRKWDRFSDDQKRTMLETIDHDADRVTRLLKELLAVSRIDAGRLQLHRERIDLAAVLEGLVDRARHRDDTGDRDVTFVSNGLLPPLFVDPDKVEQVFSNIIDNALKYAPDGPVRIEATADDGLVRVSISDTGPGIPPDQVRRIFEKFGRGRGERRSGTGLGLFITRGLIVAHGGRVWCESEEGKGATFVVELPLGTD